MLEENLSFCVERDMHHHGNCRSGLVNSIPFVKKRKSTPPPAQDQSQKITINVGANAWQIVDLITLD
jgi:hypothetical protein